MTTITRFAISYLGNPICSNISKFSTKSRPYRLNFLDRIMISSTRLKIYLGTFHHYGRDCNLRVTLNNDVLVVHPSSFSNCYPDSQKLCNQSRIISNRFSEWSVWCLQTKLIAVDPTESILDASVFHLDTLKSRGI